MRTLSATGSLLAPDLHILYETLYGSHLYGTNTPSSDEDIKFIFLPSIESLLRGDKIKNKFKSTGSDDGKNTSEDIDFECVPLQVFMRDFFGGQTYAIEVAFGALSDNHKKQHIHNPYFIQICRELTSRFLTSNMKSMVGYAVNQAIKYSDKGERLHVLEQLIDIVYNAIQIHGKDARTGIIADSVDAMANEYVYITVYDIDATGTEKRPCVIVNEKIFGHDVKLDYMLDNLTKIKNTYGKRARQASEEGFVDWKAMAHAVRISQQAIVLLETGTLTLPWPDMYVDLFLKIKHNQMPFEQVDKMITDNLLKIERLQRTTCLPDSTPELKQEFNEYLDSVLKTLYGVR